MNDEYIQRFPEKKKNYVSASAPTTAVAAAVATAITDGLNSTKISSQIGWSLKNKRKTQDKATKICQIRTLNIAKKIYA